MTTTTWKIEITKHSDAMEKQAARQVYRKTMGELNEYLYCMRRSGMLPEIEGYTVETLFEYDGLCFGPVGAGKLYQLTMPAYYRDLEDSLTIPILCDTHMVEALGAVCAAFEDTRIVKVLPEGSPHQKAVEDRYNAAFGYYCVAMQIKR